MGKNISKSFKGWFVFGAILMGALQGKAEVKLTYKDLILKDLEQVNALVKEKINEAKNAGEGSGVGPLKDGLRILLSRPDTDNMIDKILPGLQHELDERDAWNRAVEELADESINLLKDHRGVSSSVLVTHVIFLENLLAELKPELQKEGFAHSIFVKIRDAEIKLPKDAEKERYRNLMKASKESPSEIAAKALERFKSSKSK